jgi:hypothetical protein
MSSNDEIVEVYVDIEHETDESFLVSDGDNEGWVAKSLIENYRDNRDDFEVGAYVQMDIPLWKAKELELV